MITIFTYNRPEMLSQLLGELKAALPLATNVIVDDAELPVNASLPKQTKYHLFKHGGKPGFHRLWDYALKQCGKAAGDFFLFLPDDYSELDIERMQLTYKVLKRQRAGKPFCCKVVNDGRGPQWTKYKETEHGAGLTRIDWLDCSFFCNRAALEAIGFFMFPISANRYIRDPKASSGVGQQLTLRFNKAGVPIYRPIKSFAFHGDHESSMHPEERKRLPLISL